jgi:aminopeptidase
MPSDQLLMKYAEVAVELGLGIETGDRLIVEMESPAMADFARLIADSAYAAGAENVDVLWLDDYLMKSRFALGDAAAADAVTGHSKLLKAAAETGDFKLRLGAANPELPADVDPAGVSRFDRVNREYAEEYRHKAMSGRLHWCMLGVPTAEWAAVVFPDLEVGEAVEALWGAVLRACRIDRDDPVAAWAEHNAQLRKRAELLTARQFESLRYEGPGTDLKLGLPEQHLWHGGEAQSALGRVFNPNIPTEEVFTAPHRLRGDGVVKSTKPLILNGVTVEEFVLEVSDGRVEKASASSGQDMLDQVLQQDEGAAYFGEVALVPQSSAVARENLVWRHPLFDENDASHIALGEAFPICVADDAEEKTPEELFEAGLNTSSTHIDFVVGSRELSVFGVHRDGSEEPLLGDGEWVSS